jgi:SulP family sulfate permease
VVSLAGVAFYISSASLMFQDTLAPQLPVAIGVALLGSAVLAFTATAQVSLRLVAVGPEPSTVPILASICAGVAADTSGATQMPTAIAALTVTAFAIGSVSWLMGRRGWGDLVRFIPYPVIGGFLGAVGWLLVVGGAGVSVGQALDLRHADRWFAAHAGEPLAAGVAIGLAIWWTMQRVRRPLALPVLILAGGAAVHLGLWGAGLDLAQARAQGWLLPAFERTLPPWPGSPQLLAAVDWGAVAQQAGLVFSAVVVAALALPLSDSSLEVSWDERADINRDLRVLGRANMIAAGLGGLAGGISISRSVLNHAAGAASRASSYFQGAVCMLVLLWGGPAVGLLPRPLLGGLLIYLGVGLLQTWLVDGRRLARTDYAIIVAMVVLTALLGFLPAVCLGVVACCVQLAISSARLSPVRRLIARSAWPGRIERGAALAEHLDRQGGRLRIVELQGFLFFGSTTRLGERIEALLAAEPLPQRLLFDFRHVHGLDSSAAQSLGRLFKHVRGAGVEVAVSGLSMDAQSELRRAEAVAAGVVEHADIDAAVGAWDEAELAHAGLIDAWPRHLFGSAEAAERALPFFETRDLAAGEVLFAQGDRPDAIYLLRSGRLSAHVRQGAREVWVRSIHAGGMVGEMGVFRGMPRSATVRAEADSVVLRLSAEHWIELQLREPALAARLDRHFLTLMAARIDQLTAQAHELSR